MKNYELVNTQIINYYQNVKKLIHFKILLKPLKLVGTSPLSRELQFRAKFYYMKLLKRNYALGFNESVLIKANG